MPYPQTDWKDHVVEKPNTYRETVNSDGTKTYAAAPGEIVQQGTPMSATNFNKLEEGVGSAVMMGDLLFTELLLKLGHSDKTLEGLDEELSAAIAALQTAVTGGTITAKQAQTLTQVLGIALGGTGASTAAGARTNLDVPSNADITAERILADAQRSVDLAKQRDLEERLITAEAQLAALAS